MNLQLPRPTFAFALPTPISYRGAIYDGYLVGALSGGQPVRPVWARWPDKAGRFSFALPARYAGRALRLFEGEVRLFSRGQTGPGGPVDVQSFPRRVQQAMPQALGVVRLPG
jgi:hypothetical protein